MFISPSLILVYNIIYNIESISILKSISVKPLSTNGEIGYSFVIAECVRVCHETID